MNINRLTKTLKYIGLISGIFIFIYYLQFDYNYENKKELENIDYPALEENFSNEYKGRLVYYELSSRNKGSFLIQLSNGDKVSLSPYPTKNYKYFTSSLKDILSVGDSIYKPKNSDTIYVFKKNNIYYFRLGKILSK